MDYDEFKRNLRATGLSIVEFAALMQMPHRQSITNYSKIGFVPHHFAVIALLMVALTDAGGDVRAALGGIEMTRKKPRGAGFKSKQDVEK
jgi:hypothetical protein